MCAGNNSGQFYVESKMTVKKILKNLSLKNLTCKASSRAPFPFLARAAKSIKVEVTNFAWGSKFIASKKCL